MSTPFSVRLRGKKFHDSAESPGSRPIDEDALRSLRVVLSRLGLITGVPIAKEGFSEALQNAVFNDTWILLREAIDRPEL